MIIFFLPITVLLLVYLIGICILSFFDVNRKYIVLFAPAIASYIIGILSLISFFINIDTKIFIILNIFMISLLSFYFYKHILNLFFSKYFLIFFLFYLSMLCLQTSMNDYGGAFWYGDWYMHYDISLFYSGVGSADNVAYFGYTFISRTPLLNLISAYFMRLFGSNFYIFQIVSVFF